MDRVFAALTLPLLPAWWLVTALHPRLRVDLRERWGQAPPLAQPGSIWIHGASVGEIQAAARLLPLLPRPILLTADTDTGAQLARRIAGEAIGVTAQIRPVDHGLVLAALWAEARPRIVIFVEGTFWPSLAWRARRAGVPVIRLGAKAGPRTRRWGPLLRWWWRPTDAVLARDEASADWLRAVQDAPVEVIGDLKALPLAAAASPLCFARAFVVGASTREGDEARLLDATVDLPLQILLAPRHLDRLEAVVACCDARARSWVLRSRLPDGRVPPGIDVVILDTLGELHRALIGASAALIGGTFDPAIGGHTPREAAAVGVPVVAGPHGHAQGDAFEAVGAIRVHPEAGPGGLADVLTRLCALEPPDGSLAPEEPLASGAPAASGSLDLSEGSGSFEDPGLSGDPAASGVPAAHGGGDPSGASGSFEEPGDFGDPAASGVPAASGSLGLFGGAGSFEDPGSFGDPAAGGLDLSGASGSSEEPGGFGDPGASGSFGPSGGLDLTESPDPERFSPSSSSSGSSGTSGDSGPAGRCRLVAPEPEQIQRALAPYLGAAAPEAAPRPWAVGLGLGLGLVAEARTVAYGLGLRRAHLLPVPVISVGSTNARSPGRTSIVRALVAQLAARGHAVGVALRGYRRQRAGRDVRISTQTTSAADLGDEGALLAAAGAVVAAAPDRVAAARALVEAGVSVIVLDDGLQHRRLHRDLDLAVIDARFPSARGLLPMGERRELWPVPARVDLVLVQHQSALFDAPGLPVIRTLGPWRSAAGPSEPPEGSVLAFCGIGRPADFLASLDRPVGDFVPLADHQPLTEGLAATLLARAEGRPLVCTAKDAVRLPPSLRAVTWWRDVSLELPDGLLERLPPYQDS